MGNIKNCKKIFVQKCACCYTVGKGGKLKTGPNLHHLPGQKMGQNTEFSYQMPVRAEAVWGGDTGME